jgi:NTE family protein
MTRALVLSGGGPVGIAWEAGLLAGLAEGGVDLGQADFILGTSAGSFVGSQLAMGKKAGDLAAAILAEADRVSPAVAAGSRPSGGGGAPNLSVLFQKMQEARSGERDPQEVRREIGQFALEAKTIDEESFIKSFGRQLSGPQADGWPSERGYACTAVDAETGEFVMWTAESKVGLARAVASSCSVPGVYPPITINGRRYIDGGMRSGSNADLATGHELVVVVGLRTAGDAEMSARMRAPLEKEMQVLRDGGARTELILPDDASVAAFGANLMDGRVRPAAAKAGIDQGRALAPALKGVWG